MTFNENFGTEYCVISQDDDNDNSLMLKVELFSTEEEYTKALIINGKSNLNSFKQEDLSEQESNQLCKDKYAHDLKSKLRSRISNTLRRVKARSWISSRYRLQTAKSQHDQICEFIKVAVSQTRTSNEKTYRSIKIKNIDYMSNSEQLEESTYNSLQQLKNNKAKDQIHNDE